MTTVDSTPIHRGEGDPALYEAIGRVAMAVGHVDVMVRYRIGLVVGFGPSPGHIIAAAVGRTASSLDLLRSLVVCFAGAGPLAEDFGKLLSDRR